MNDNSLGTIQEAKTTVNESELDRIMQVHIDSGMFTKEQLAEMRKAEANRLKEAKNTEKQKEQVVKKDETKEKPKAKNQQSTENLSQEERQKLSDEAFSIKERRTASGEVVKGSMGALYAKQSQDIIKSLVTDKTEREEIVEGVGNIIDEKVNNIKNIFTKTIPAEISRIHKTVAFSGLYDKEELDYLKTLDPNDTYKEPSGDPTGFKTNADRIKYLEGYKNTSAAKQEEKINKYITEKYKEVEVYNKYLRKDTGEGIVKGLKQGDASDVVLGVFNAGASVAETVVPAMLTGGYSLPFQITAPMLMDYNQQKAERIYGKDDPDAVLKLLQNKEDEIAIPGALGFIATGFEYIGYKGITNYMLGKAAKGTAAKLLLTGNKEGITELGQSGIEEVNMALAQGKKGLDVGKAFFDGIFSEKGLESYLQGFIGGTGMSAGGRAVNRALRSDNASVKKLNSLIDDLSELNIAKNSAKNTTAKEAIEVEIKQSEQALKKYIKEKRKIADILNEDQKQNLIDAINEKDNITSKVESLKSQLNNNEISSKEFGYAIRSLNNQDKRLTEQIELINQSAKEQLLQTSLETTKQETEKLGLEQIELSQEEFAKQFPDDADSDGAIQGNKIFINRDVARETGAIGVGSHELLHGIIGNSYQKLSKEEKVKLNTEFLNLLGKKEKQAILTRLANSYSITGDKVFETEELFTAFSDEIVDGGLVFNEGVFGKVKNTVHKVLNKLGYKKEFESARQTYNFLKDYSKNIKKGKLTEAASEFAKQDPGIDGTRMSKSSPEQLVKIIQRGRNPQKVKEAEDALAPQFELLALSEKALNYDTRKGDIAREDVVAEAMTYLPGIIKRFDPTTSKFSTFVIANMKPKQQVIYEKVKPLTYGETTSIDTKEARQVEDTSSETTNTEDTFVQKINILQDFAIANRVADKIKALVKVVKGDNFKSIISKYAGKVGELIFEIPANKIMEGGANLTAVTKYTEGMPAPAEAQNIQRFFNAPNNADKFIKTLPLYNVTDKTADINKVGENLDVSRDTYGYAIGLKGLPLDYFYENYTDPTGEITSPKGRSKGLTSQTPVKRLKPQFRKPTPDVVEQFKKDLGITPKNEANVYSRDIGQLLKGVAKVHSINAAISGAQRFQEAKTKAAPVTEQKAIKQQTADITAAQSKVAFSKSTQRTGRLMRQNLRIDDAKFRDKLLSINKLAPTLRIKKEGDIKVYIDMLKKDVFPILPKAAWFGPGKGTAFDSSSKGIGVNSSSDPLWIKFQEEIKKLKNDDSIVYGPDIKGVDMDNMWSLRTKYTPLFSTPEKARKNIKNGEIAKFNEQVGLIHKALWKRINKSIKDTKGESASGIATYLGLVANDTGHWHKMGAQFAGFSKKITKRKKDKKGKNQKSRVEYEHAMVATEAYIYLLDAAINHAESFDYIYGKIIENYKLIALDKAMDDKLKNARTKSGRSLMTNMPDGWNAEFGSWWERYFNNIVGEQDGGIDPSSIEGLDGKTFAETLSVNAEGNSSVVKTGIQYSKTLNKAIAFSRSTNNETKGITVLDFDDTLATSKSNVLWTAPDGTTGKLTAEEFAKQGADLLAQGYVYDFSEFNKVVKGKKAPLFEKALKLQSKFGPENMFILTARPAESAASIFEFVKANGLNIPLKNITGLANSTAEAKALWMVDKVSEGYNDFYFADDALQNVQAVKNMLDQFDVKSKVQQAKVKFSKSMSNEFNNILDDVTGVESQKVFSEAQAKIRGQKSKYKSIIPPSAQDFAGLLYNFLGKGKKGEKQMAFFKKALIDPFARAINELNAARQASANDYENLLKQFPKVKKLLNKKIEGTDYTHDQAARIYLWNKAGFDIPGLSKRDLKTVLDFVENNSDIKSFAETVGLISKKEDGYSTPGDYWLAENIKSDLLSDGSIGDARSEFLAEWQQNADIIFSPENLNKIEAIYGSNFREALEDILYRMKTGRNRPTGGGRLMNIYTNWVNNSVGAIMFFNMRSALLQTISATNYINWSDNNPLKAAAAFANQKQYWKDFSYLFNSDYLKQRRAGNQRGVNEAELSAAVAGAENKAKAAITWLLKKGFLPTQIADSFAIASGGATFYRNRIKALVKEGMTQEQAEKQAFLDFQETTEVAQQSARPDMISQQQASPLGKLILAFQNTPMQYARIMNKAARDLVNGRGDSKTHMSKIIYYGFVQSIIFGALQSALFASLDDEDEERFDKKKERILNGMVDSVLSGIGYGGKAVSTMKNTLITFLDQRKRGFNADHTYTILQLLGFSPPIGSKLRKVYSSIQTDKFNKDVFLRRGFTLDNPIWSAVGNVVEGVTNVPLGRLSQKMLNIDNALDANNKWWQRVALVLGWNTWDLGIRDADIEGIKADVKKEGKKKKKKESQKDQININKQKQKQEKKEGKKVTCAAISKSGNRCKTKVEPGSSFCTIHEEVKQNKSGKKVQCKKIKSNKKRCGMQTSSAGGYCYYHD